MWSSVLLSLVAVPAVLCVVNNPAYTVPPPFVEAFTPKGLRVSIADSKDIKSVHFSLSLSHPVSVTVSGEFNKEVISKEGSHWIYWNPSILVKHGDTVHYRLVVQHRDLFWTREGEYLVDQEIPLSEDVECEEVNEETAVAGSGSRSAVEEDNPAKISSGRRSGYQSSYSMHKGMDMKPITKSSSTTTTGSFLIRQGGVEGAGYKTSSSYDSSKRDGEQWQHSRSELSAAEIEELQRLHGDGWRSFSSYQGFAKPSGSYKYEESYYTQNHGAALPLTATGNTQSTIRHDQTVYRTPANTFKFQIPVQAHGGTVRGEDYESLSQAPTYGSSGTSYQYRKEATSSVSQSNPGREHILQTIQTPSYRPVSYEYERKETSNHDLLPAAPVKPVTTYEYQRKETTSTSGDVPVVSSSGYKGTVFTSYIRATSPQECQILDIDVRGTASLADVEKSVSKLTCLATLAETTLREELRRVREDNSELHRRFQLLEDKLARLKDSCECLQITGS